jgi:hypothetical protein
MAFLADLWLPILLSAVLVFIASSIMHMVIPMHKGDYQKLPNEGKLLEEMRAQGARPGEYMFPRAGSMKEMGTPEMIDKYKKGPVGFLTVMPSGPPGMTKSFVQWFLYSVLISIFAAYVARHGLGYGADYMAVFRMTGTVATLGYAVTQIPNSIWRGARWGTTFKFIVDGVIYGLLTAGAFGWLWPDAM